MLIGRDNLYAQFIGRDRSNEGMLYLYVRKSSFKQVIQEALTATSERARRTTEARRNRFRRAVLKPKSAPGEADATKSYQRIATTR